MIPIPGISLPILGNWRVWAFAILLLTCYALYERGNAAISRLDAFTAQVEAVGQQAIARNERINRENKDRIAVALSERDAALKRLRDESARPSGMPLIPAAPEGSNAICFDPTGLSAAVERFRADVRGLVTQGDEAVIDSRALIQSWPK